MRSRFSSDIVGSSGVGFAATKNGVSINATSERLNLMLRGCSEGAELVA